MKEGKVSESILNRSVFKLFRHRREEIAKKPTAGTDVTKFTVGKGEEVCISTNPVTVSKDELGKKALYYVGNNIACANAEFVGVVVNMLFPRLTDEKDIKQIMNDLENECQKLNVEVMGGHTELLDSVNKPLITITGIGKLPEHKVMDISHIKPGYEIVMTKWAGMEGAAYMAKDAEKMLKDRYKTDLINKAKELHEQISVIDEAKIAGENGALYMHDVTHGGVFAGLWELSCGIKHGIEVDIKKIPIKQEIVEICEFFDINPYLLKSRGVLLIVAKHGASIVNALSKNGLESAVIGKVCEHNNKIVVNDDEMRYLDSPSGDEIYKYLEKYANL